MKISDICFYNFDFHGKNSLWLRYVTATFKNNYTTCRTRCTSRGTVCLVHCLWIGYHVCTLLLAHATAQIYFDLINKTSKYLCRLMWATTACWCLVKIRNCERGQPAITYPVPTELTTSVETEAQYYMKLNIFVDFLPNAAFYITLTAV